MAENIGTIFQWLIFLGMAFISVLASFMVITRKNPIHSALFLVLTFLCVAVLYLLLYSQFIAIIQVVVYAGAIVMLIVFVIMLLDLENELRSRLKIVYSKVIGGFLAVLFLFGILYSVVAKSPTGKMEGCRRSAFYSISFSFRDHIRPSRCGHHRSGHIKQEKDIRRVLCGSFQPFPLPYI
jgi:NADH:ubiquinone oxidoreductase subunit 6 (subunit J)